MKGGFRQNKEEIRNNKEEIRQNSLFRMQKRMGVPTSRWMNA